MNFKKTTSYSLSILSFMAKNPGQTVSADTLHEALEIPYQYLRSMLTALSRNGFISGSRGRTGGFLLRKKPEDILLYDIVVNIEGAEVFNKCIMGFESCPFNNVCPMHDIWESARTGLEKNLRSMSLQDLVAKSVK
ncbi:MAG: Rrf2 family transcriptional regulator [Bacteroidales bacterium]